MSTFTPTPEQQAIIAAIAEGKSIIVNALAGAAKTSTIALAGAQAPANSCALAFNKKIQIELASRLPATFTTKTINAMGLGVWSKFVGGKCTVDSSKVNAILRKLDPEIPWAFTQVISAAKLNGLVPTHRQVMGQGILPDNEGTWNQLADDLDLQLFYRNNKTQRDEPVLPTLRKALEISIDEAFKGNIDFDDQVYMPTCFGAPFPKYDCVFVDEAQDLSPLNHLMLKRMKPKQLVVVGDPLQSIYAFRGADTSSMPKLQEDWNLPAYTLSISFRCGKAIADLARQWAPNLQSPEWAQPGEVIMDLSEHHNRTMLEWTPEDLPAKCTIICRNNAPLIKLALKMFKTRKVAFINNKAETTMLSFLRKLVNYKKDTPLDVISGKIEGKRMTALDTSDPKKHERINDEFDAIQFCVDAALADGRDYMGLERLISELFQAKHADYWFTTGHGSKGLEWDAVLHLDPHLLPSSYAKSEEALQQEANIHYVITTRAKRWLAHAHSDLFQPFPTRKDTLAHDVLL